MTWNANLESAPPPNPQALGTGAEGLEYLKGPTTRGVIDVSPLKNRVAAAAEATSYVIEPVIKDPVTGKPTAEPRMVAVEDFAKALEGFLEVGPDGKVKPTGCFAAGTLVHTADGLVPIEKLRAGTMVLSQPEDGGERAMRRVVNKFSRLDQPLMAIQVKAIEADGAETFTTLFATPNHPFWVETSLTEDGKHWLAAECLEAGIGLQLADGRRAEVRSAALIRRTQHEGVFFAADERVKVGQLLCMQGECLQIAPAGLEASLGAGPLRLGETDLAPVYNFEVEEFHTYYVGEEGAGVWVHNTGCKIEDAAASADRAAALNNALQLHLLKMEVETTCFDGDTAVLVKVDDEMPPSMRGYVATPVSYLDFGPHSYCNIEYIRPGAKVLSRCEVTGELAYKKVVNVFERWYQGDMY
ncbi:polymorphic toxin-type HINT domain-containing protein [Pelomonas nitida]|uniref:Polymorphic toxin-type HINT domain-containing protein n=1 Tax=Pelomonas nitida TaxID=3299027 RepID=A0ABW7G931_9BURK